MSQCHSSISSNCCTSNSIVTDVITDDAFGVDPFHDFDINRSFTLPDDRQQTAENNHIDRVWSTTFTLNSDISNHFFNLASMNHTTPEYVALTCYAIFVFKFTGREQDFHVLQNVNVRHGPQLSNTTQKTTNRCV
jgi:hypothetical protein